MNAVIHRSQVSSYGLCEWHDLPSKDQGGAMVIPGIIINQFTPAPLTTQSNFFDWFIIITTGAGLEVASEALWRLCPLDNKLKLTYCTLIVSSTLEAEHEHVTLNSLNVPNSTNFDRANKMLQYAVMIIINWSVNISHHVH